MRIGIQLPNHNRPLSELELERLKALRPTCLRAYTYNTSQQFQQVLALGLAPLILLTANFGGQVNAAREARSLWASGKTLRDLNLEFWLAPVNEPNHQDGPYPTLGSVDQFKADYVPLVGELQRIFPAVPLISPNLAVMQGELTWANKCRDLWNTHDYIGWNSYWQYDNYLSPDWGMGYQGAKAIFPEKKFVVLEMGDSTPGRPSNERMWRMKLVLRALSDHGDVAAVSIFILGYDEQAPQTWGEFVYEPQDLVSLSNADHPEIDLKVLAQRIGESYGIPWELLDRLITQESGWDPTAISPAGAEGLMQLMPSTFPNLDLLDPEANIEAGSAYLTHWLSKNHYDWALALASYNAGPGAVQSALSLYGPDWMLGLPEETKLYLKRILYPA